MTKMTRLCCFTLILSSCICFAQQITITGDIRDQNTHEKISNVNIFVKNSQVGTTSTVNGQFSLDIPTSHPDSLVVFQHIAYKVREIALDSLRQLTTIYLQPRIIPLSQLRIEAQGEPSGIQSDLPQAITIKRADNFANRGFIDAADYLSTDQSIQVEEQISGKKSISIRGSNPDDVLVLYNGIKMNSAFDNTFDLSLIDLEDIERLEIFRGSQTSVTGTGGFAGVVNIVPKIERDYLIKFQQRVGTYNSGTWGLSLYKNFNDLHSAYSYRKGGSTRQFSGSDFGQDYLINKSEQHTANLDYRFDNNLLSASYLRSHLDYDNQRYRENINNMDQLVSLRYRGRIFRFSGFDLAASQHQLQEDQHLNSSSRFFSEFLDKHLENTSYNYTVNKKWLFSNTEFFLSYQFEDASLNFRDQLTNPERNRTDIYNEQMRRQHHGFVAIAKLFNQLESRYIPVFDMDICMRNDHLTDARETDQFSTDKTWNKTTLKFSSNMEGQSQNVVYHGYFNYGKNVKFPTMLQQVSSTQRRAFSDDTTQLKPEISNGYDLGFEMSGETPEAIVSAIEGWQISFYLFRNFFTDKLRTSYTPGFPLAYYDNVQTAQISGFETRAGLFLLNKKLTLEIGYSNYAISDKAAFPFKYDNKFTVDTKINHHGYNFHLHAFYEGEQIGWIRDFAGGFDEVTLPAHFNLDLHLKKNIEIKKFKILANISVRNLLNENIELVGLALRDRRYYLTVGVAY
ncbi:TonB-dependent receptor plug domain-containing protein [candidate division KSB1 bacterium]|nr:TonB-dependent receptor plug domain-containing protein [candidate division KSB1 bacterium]